MVVHSHCLAHQAFLQAIGFCVM